ncbi:MAG: hypothetical protein AAF742_02495 [Pseudomonadota bacterium]
MSIWALIGFAFAAYAVVGNDALQTLGTFINSNDRFPWWVLFLFGATIMVAAFYYGWSQGDPSYGRLDRFPPQKIEWYHALPPIVLVFLTRTGIPVSTTFLVLTIFSVGAANLTSMLEKSLVGYGVAFLAGATVYLVVAPTAERFFIATKSEQHHPGWIALQWLSTGFLWWQWLSQDFANIYVFLPRDLNFAQATASITIVVLLLAVTFANGGGPVQKILASKRSVTDIRSATIIDFIFAWLLYYFKELNNIPMSTTWVFLGLIAGREFVIRHIDLEPGRGITRILGDLGDAVSGFFITLFRYLFIGVDSKQTAKDETFIKITGRQVLVRRLTKFLPLATLVSFLILFYVIPSASYQDADSFIDGIVAALTSGHWAAILAILLVLIAAFAQPLTKSGIWASFRLEEEDVIEAADGVHSDAVKALIGLVISVMLAIGVPRIAPLVVGVFGG